MEYNSGRPKMVIPEYGRNIQKMVDFATQIEDRDERNRCARTIIGVMGQLNPHLRDIADFNHKLWDHLFIISNFNLDVDSPYDKPSPEVLNEKPELLEYPDTNLQYKHYGKVTQALIKKAVEFEEGEEKQFLVDSIANLMKRTYLTWNNDSVADEVILNDLKSISGGKLETSKDFQFEHTAEILARTNTFKKKKRSGGGRQNQRNRKRN